LLQGLPGVAGRSTGAVLDEFLPGIPGLLTCSTGFGPGFTILMERLRVTPTARVALLAHPILAHPAAMFLFVALLGGVGALFGFRTHLALPVVAVLAGWLAATVSAFSMALALRSGGEIQGLAAAVNGLNLPVLLLGGALPPPVIGPVGLRVLGHFDPLHYLVAAARTLAQGPLASDTRQAFAVLVPHCAVTFAWATRTYRSVIA
jgi:hypothetical protein